MPVAPAAAAPVHCKRHPTVEKHRNAQGNRVCRDEMLRLRCFV